MGINEFKEAKIKLENEIEMALNEFDRKFGTEICDINHSCSKLRDSSMPTPAKVFHSIKLKIEI